MKMQINSLQLSAAFGAIQIAVYPVTAVHKAALCLQALLYEMEIKSTKRTNHRRLASRNGGVDSRAVKKKMEFRISHKILHSNAKRCIQIVGVCQAAYQWHTKCDDDVGVIAF